MQCEICGAEIKGGGQYIRIGDSEMLVCKACVRYGEIVSKKAPYDTAIKGDTHDNDRRRSAMQKKVYLQMDHEIAEIETEREENYGKRIKEARERRGMSQHDLAKRINEKQSLLRKIERGEVVPSEEIRGKIERTLGLNLKFSLFK
jgi:putative transcription factor